MNKVITFIFLFFFCSTSKSQTHDTKDSLYRILVCIEPTRREQIASEVAPKFGFRYDYIGFTHKGDTIIPPNLDSMNKENEKSYSLIGKKLGSNWQIRFDKEVDRVYKNWIRIFNFLDTITAFESILEKVNLKREGDFCILKEIRVNKVFIIEYTFYDTEKHIISDKRNFKINLSRRDVREVIR